ncbi:uncharacterized protein PG986_012023 [Apiospora aurea]|uniref:GPI anchored protein n=1 Tax=Apiospora aurea TaxID=335848 RepID=A0ABR1PYT1_9PEZI
MRAVFPLLALGSATIVFAQEPRQRVEYSAGLFPGDGNGVVLAAASSGCALLETTCESGCMPIGSVVSSLHLALLLLENESESLLSYAIISPPQGRETANQCVCNSGGCCPIGKTCKDGSGASSCAAGKAMCGIGCMPTTADCCSDGTYCPSGSKCTSNGYCCRNGQTCSGGSGSGSGGSGSGSSAGDVGHSSISIGGGGGGGGAVTTSSRRASSTPTSDDLETSISKLSVPAAQTADETTKAPTTPSKTPTKTPASPGTVTVTPSASSLPGGSGAGALDRADGKLAVGLAVAAALLI